MGEAQNTPGPWRVVGPHTESDGSVYPAHIEGGARELHICSFGPNWESDVMMESADDVRSKRANARLIATAPILTDLYTSEINFSLETFWDGGFDAKLGDGMNGFKAEDNFNTYVEAVEQLRDWAIAHYPDSSFAKKYRVPA